MTTCHTTIHCCSGLIPPLGQTKQVRHTETPVLLLPRNGSTPHTHGLPRQPRRSRRHRPGHGAPPPDIMRPSPACTRRRGRKGREHGEPVAGSCAASCHVGSPLGGSGFETSVNCASTYMGVPCTGTVDATYAACALCFRARAPSPRALVCIPDIPIVGHIAGTAATTEIPDVKGFRRAVGHKPPPTLRTSAPHPCPGGCTQAGPSGACARIGAAK